MTTLFPSICTECGRKMPAGMVQQCTNGDLCSWHMPAHARAVTIEMYEALKALLLTKRPCKVNPGNEEIHAVMCGECQARAALAKAEGRQP